MTVIGTTSTATTCTSTDRLRTRGLAVRYGAISINPVREVDRIEHDAKKRPRALSCDEVQLLWKQLATDERAADADLPDLVTFMLSTGVRIGGSGRSRTVTACLGTWLAATRHHEFRRRRANQSRT
jgi:hypothetical protein